MAKGTRNLAMAAAAVAVLGTPSLSVAADAIPGPPASSSTHVRSSSQTLLGLIQQAGQRSATFRGLVETIEASDTIVFVEEGLCGHGVRACFVSVTGTNRYRYMQVVVDTRRKADWDLMGSIGHELRHTIEVIAEPAVRDNSSKFFLYQQIGTLGTASARETQAAVEAGNNVRAEVRRSSAQMRSE